MRAMVLTKAHAGQVKEAAHFIRKIRAVREVHCTFGPYDIITIIEAERLADIGKIVANEIQPIPGVELTLTCLMVDG